MTMRPTVPAINDALKIAFGEGVCYVSDPGDMSYAIFSFTEMPNYKILDLIKNRDVLPVPAAVGIKWVVLEPAKYFGFGAFSGGFGYGFEK